MTDSDQQLNQQSKLQELLDGKTYLQIPQVGDLVKGTIITLSKNEVRIDIEGYRSGIIRGRELYDESGEHTNLKISDEVEATVMEVENEKGEVELSFRFAGHKKAWDKLEAIRASGELVKAKVTEANRGGLLMKIGQVAGFLPVSQLAPENYPRVPGGDKAKILEKLKSYVGQDFDVQVITAEENSEKLIVSEKAAQADKQKKIIAAYEVGQVVEGVVTAVTDFGVFVSFGENLEGLIHISELAWQRIEDPRNFIKTGVKVKAEIISIEKEKIFLSMKKLQADPWDNVNEKYKVGEKVKGKVLKVNPFGLFVELDPEIHGLAHISELSDKPIHDIKEIASVGDEVEFMVVSIEPDNHRLGLSLKALNKKASPSSASGEAAKVTEATNDSDEKDEEAEEKKEEVKEPASAPSPSSEASSSADASADMSAGEEEKS